MVEEDSESVCGELVAGREDSDDNVAVSSSTKRAKLTKTTKESRRKAELIIKATNYRSQRTNHVTTKEDRLSALPDSLLLHILYYLDTKQVMRTCVLSKRWQFLWTDMSKLELIETSRDIAKNCSFVDSVGRILVMCSGIHLNKLCVSFWYQQCYASNVNLWVQFAVKNKVKEFNLECLSNKDRYLLPQMLYSNSSFTSLLLGCCQIAPRGAISWRFLKSLWIQYVELTQFVLQKILWGCPVLEVLRLTMFWGLNHLEILSRNLSQLVVDGWKNSNQCDCLDISAPYVRFLSVLENKVTRFVIGGSNISPLVAAKLDYTFAEDAATFSQVDFMILPGVQQSIESFRSVEELILGPWCIEVLSRMEAKGLHLSPSTRLCLTLTAWRHKRSIAGILNILKSSPNLETLVITGTSFEPHMISDSHNQAATYLLDDSLDLVLLNLKTVKISGFSVAGLAGEPMLTLVQHLLKNAMVLEKMVIDAQNLTGSLSTTCYSTDFTEISLKLLTFPRSSPKAVVMVC